MLLFPEALANQVMTYDASFASTNMCVLQEWLWRLHCPTCLYVNHLLLLSTPTVVWNFSVSFQTWHYAMVPFEWPELFFFSSNAAFSADRSFRIVWQCINSGPAICPNVHNISITELLAVSYTSNFGKPCDMTPVRPAAASTAHRLLCMRVWMLWFVPAWAICHTIFSCSLCPSGILLEEILWRLSHSFSCIVVGVLSVARALSRMNAHGTDFCRNILRLAMHIPAVCSRWQPKNKMANTPLFNSKGICINMPANYYRSFLWHHARDELHSLASPGDYVWQSGGIQQRCGVFLGGASTGFLGCHQV